MSSPADPDPRAASEVLVLAGGEGRRLRDSRDPAVASRPKLLVEISPDGGTPVTMISYVIREIVRSGFARITVLTAPSGRHGDEVESYVRAGADFPVRPAIVREAEPKGTGGAVRAALAQVTAPHLIVTPGDIIFPFGLLPAAVAAHRDSGCPATWVVTTRADPGAQNLGRIIADPGSRLVRHVLEGTRRDPAGYLRPGDAAATSAGVVILAAGPIRPVFGRFVADRGTGGPFDLYTEFLPWAVARGVRVGFYDVGRVVHDLGTPDRLTPFLRR